MVRLRARACMAFLGDRLALQRTGKGEVWKRASRPSQTVRNNSKGVRADR